MAYLQDASSSFPIHLGLQKDFSFDLLAPRGFGHFGGTFWTSTPGEKPEEAFKGKRIFTDGSCYKNGPRSTHCAGWAVAAVNNLSECTASLHGPVGDAVARTSPVSEHIAFLAEAISVLTPWRLLWATKV